MIVCTLKGLVERQDSDSSLVKLQSAYDKGFALCLDISAGIFCAVIYMYIYTIISPSLLLTKNTIKLSFQKVLILCVKLRCWTHESNARNVKDVCVMASGVQKISHGTQLPLFICPLAIYLFKVPNNCPIHASHPFQSVC